MSRDSFNISSQLFSLTVTLKWGSCQYLGPAIVDSGAVSNFIAEELVDTLKIPRTPCFPPLRVNAIDG